MKAGANDGAAEGVAEEMDVETELMLPAPWQVTAA